MLARKQKIFTALTAGFGLGVIAFVYAAHGAPGVVTYTLTKFAGLEALTDGTRVEQSNFSAGCATYRTPIPS